MAGEQKKKRTCAVCSTEHNVGEACPQCEWDQEAEERRARGEIVREEIRENLRKETGTGGKKKKGFWD